MRIEAKWDRVFGKREPGTEAIFLMAGNQCLGYVSKNRERYMACVGAGMGAPIVAVGPDLNKAKAAVEQEYRA